MNDMIFDAMRRQAEDAEIAAVLATIKAPAELSLAPIDPKPHPPLHGRVLINALEAQL